jgi:hypothetical protein
MTEKIIALDIETANLDMKQEGLEFSNPKGWRTACVCVYDSVTQEEHFYVEDEYVLTVLNDGLKTRFRKRVKNIYFLSQDLERWFESGYTLLTHNGTNFDVPILRKSIDEGGGSCERVFGKSFPHIDMSHSLYQMTTFRYKLQHLVKGMLGEERSKLMDAALAPVEWNKGNYHSVLEYCIMDCILNLEVFTECASQGEIRAIGTWEYPTVPFEEFQQFCELVYPH